MANQDRVLPRGVGRAVALAVCAVLALLSPGLAAAQTFETLRSEVRQPSPASSSGPGQAAGRGSDRKGCADDGDEDGLWEGIAALTLLAVSTPYWVPRRVVGDDAWAAGYFARYPYHRDLDGFLATDLQQCTSECPWMLQEHYRWLLRARAEYEGDLDDLSSIGGAVLWDTASRWGIDSEVHYRQENGPGNAWDDLWTGDCNVVVRFAQSTRLQLRSGLGFNWLSDRQGSDFGFNFTYRGDWFPCDPWIVSAEIDWGRLGHSTLFHGRATVGVHFHRLEIYTGYDLYDVGDASINALVSGLRLWY
jgi:hypothetical protein